MVISNRVPSTMTIGDTVSVGGAGPGLESGESGLSSLLQNRLLLQYLSGAGEAISAGQPVGPELNKITQQELLSRAATKKQMTTTENFNKLLGQMLSGGGKLSLDKDNLSIKAPTSALNQMSLNDEQEAPSLINQSGNLPTLLKGTMPNENQELLNILNPSSSPLDIPSADLAGLTPEHIVQALQLKFMQDKLRQAPRVDPLDQPFVMDAPGYGNLTLRQYKSIPESDREYITHVISARRTGETPLSRNEFEAIDDKEKDPTTAMGAAIKGYIDSYGRLPPESELARWTKMFRAEPGPSPVTWTTASRNLSNRFGKEDATGRWVVTPGLQAAHDKAQEILVKLKEEGMSPLRAVNEANRRARDWQRKIENPKLGKIEDNYFRLIEMASGDEDRIDKIKNQFYRQYGY